MFHATTWAFTGIRFWPLMVCYVAFVDWHALANRLRKRTEPARPVERGGTRLTRLTGSTLVVLVVLAGLLRVESSWPIASYPIFQYRTDATATTLEVDVRVAGSWRTLDLDAAFGSWMPRQRSVGLLRSIAYDPDPARRSVQVDALWRDAARRLGVHDVDAVRVAAVTYSTDPADHGRILSSVEVLSQDV